ncbi:MAG: PilN domain-containing protein [Mariprofundales bacterium]|nr:PilN domain-containing protein [Mariprofundales bacterium]
MIRVNLLPYRAQRWRVALLKHLVVFVGVLLVVVVVIIGVHVVTSAHLDGLTETQSSLVAENRRLRKKIGQIRNIDKLRADVEGKLAVVDKLQVGRFRSLAVLLALAEAIPENVWLNSLQDAGTKIKVTGYGESNNAVAGFMRALDRSPRFSHVQLGVIKRGRIGKTTVRNFSLSMDEVVVTPDPVKIKKHRRRR